MRPLFTFILLFILSGVVSQNLDVDSLVVEGKVFKIQKRYENGSPKVVGNEKEKCLSKKVAKHGAYYKLNKDGDIIYEKEFYYGKRLNNRFLGLKQGLWLDPNHFTFYFMGIPFRKYKTKPCF